MTQPPQTGDAHVDETLARFHAAQEQPLSERAEAALTAQRRLQERLTETSPGREAPTGMHRVAGASRPAS